MSVKILVLSDSHGSRSVLKRICDMHKDADYIFFAGDGLTDVFTVTSGMKGERVNVYGNCDFLKKDATREAIVQIEGFSFWLCHGDAYGVKSSFEKLKQKALELCADVAVFGHTHSKTEICVPCADGKYLYLFNPGSVSDGSFGLISIKDGDILFSHGNVMGM